ncbi:hypothetical protein SAMN02745221_00429 [Thermosyntropha lipolytica DSM 11003]|uniref:Uncharacterized protein n=1 Tax=Thermosyntropha lipolytica DSM 11003 TaxID=1123382 RepID=A0A1M5KLM9_9FIRM|nr:hypothetical protein [Thermosyntropha lipolytica]SHG53615.1 hypothetical protein SAMN02745221_00429 [Thermosyntropha lipolytica DSM 11003]
MNSPEIRYTLVSSYTRDGFVSFIPDLVSSLKKVYVLKGAADELISLFIKRWGDFFYEKGCAVEFFLSALDPDRVDGAYVPALQVAMINGNLPKPIETGYPGWRTYFINLRDYLAEEIAEEGERKMEKIASLLQQEKEKAEQKVKEAGKIKEEMYSLSSSRLDMEEIKRLTERLIEEIGKERKKEKHYFASSFTKEGMISYLDEISRRCYRRYILKGPAGSGKSTVISNVAAFCKEQGLSVTYYHNGLDEEKLDMIIVENLQLAVIDGGEKGLTLRPGDVVLDMGKVLHFYRQEEAYRYIELGRDYEEKLIEAREHLEKWDAYLAEIGKIWAKALDFELLDRKREELNQLGLK